MRTKKYKQTLFLLLMVFGFFSAEAQLNYQLHRSRNETSWFAGANLGITSYLGDLARYNFDPIYKVKEESKFAFGFVIGKSLNQIYSAQAYFTKGGLAAYNDPKLISYDASLINYGLQLSINFNTLIGRQKYVPDSYIYGIAGAGSVIVKPQLFHISSDSLVNNTPIDSLNYSSSISTFEFNVGLGVNLSILRNMDAYAEIDYHHSFSDELDLTSGGKSDSFYHLSIGLRYRFAFAGNNGSSAFSNKR